MSESESLVRMLSSLISIFGGWLLLFWLYRDYRIDTFRQEMFALRDQFFDWAHQSKISFDDPAYGMLRSTMNGFIRFGHRLTFFQIAVLYFLTRREKANGEVGTFKDRLDEATKRLDKTARWKRASGADRVQRQDAFDCADTFGVFTDRSPDGTPANLYPHDASVLLRLFDECFEATSR